ncbi:MAG: SH3 domain-containing protein [Planctomycetes bacterium]|nr:SH3 domain-containing protein [Planctomycetota bacterium]MCB9935688.1 SH3 domain-containing protein [Planctomycetota bacterium]
MKWWKKFPWRRLLALLLVLVALAFASNLVQGETMYVKVDSSSPDAVIQSSTDFFESEALGKLTFNDEVEMLDQKDGEYVKIRAKIGDKEVEGWVKALILSKDKLLVEPRATESAGAKSSAQTSKGLNEQIEKEMREGSPEMNTALARIDNFESSRNRLLGGDATKPKPEVQQQHVKDFATNGKLK